MKRFPAYVRYYAAIVRGGKAAGDLERAVRGLARDSAVCQLLDERFASIIRRHRHGEDVR
jgi:hypothetical protein